MKKIFRQILNATKHEEQKFAAEYAARRNEVGVAVTCTTCGLRKKPIGRSAPVEMGNSLCDHECPGYYLEPTPGDLWPGETREQFSY